MKKVTHTKLKASKDFWQEQLTNQIIHTDSIVTEIDQDEITIESLDCTAEQDIIELSKQYPEYIFEAMYNGEDPYENLASTYQYQNGTRKFIKEEYEYCFEIRKEEREQLDPRFYAKFQEDISAYFKKIDNYRIRTAETDPTFQDLPLKRQDEESPIHPTIAYRDGNITLSAMKFGLTLLVIRIIETREYSTFEDYDEITGEVFDDPSEYKNNLIQ